MESTLHQNAVLTGYVDAYCLICENLLREEDVFVHIDSQIHKENLNAVPYMEKYKDEHIRKVKRGYYCEFCNRLFTTTAKVHLHIAEATHIQNKGVLIVKRVGNSGIELNDICIKAKAWNGFIEDICALCNLEFFDENIHKTERTHILNLIQKKVQYVDKKAVYRMVDNESFQCLTCNMIFAISTIETHIAENNHKIIFQKCRDGQSESPAVVKQSDEKQLKLDNVQKDIKSVKPNDSLKEIPKKSTLDTPNTQEEEQKLMNVDRKTIKSELKYESETNVNSTEKMEERYDMKPYFDQNHNDTKENQTASDEEEAENVTLNLSEVPKDVDQTLGTCSSTESPKETSSTMEITDQVEFAKEHNLTYNKGKGNAFCRLCNVRLPARLKSMKEHVNGMNHKNKEKIKKMKVPKQRATSMNRTIPMHKFIVHRFGIKGRHAEYVVLNSKLCLTVYAYSLITHNMDRLRCQVCEVNLKGKVSTHLGTPSHETALDNTPVVQNLDGEFIREVRPGLYHCGFCNLIVGEWENVAVHLQCGEHIKHKIFSDRCLRFYLPDILEHHWRRECDLRFFLATMSTHQWQSDPFAEFMHGEF